MMTENDQFESPLLAEATQNTRMLTQDQEQAKNLVQKIEEKPHYLTTSAPVSQTFSHDKPGSFVNYVQPEKMYSASNTIGEEFNVGVRTNDLSTMLYYFKNTGEFDFADDIGYRCMTYDLDFGTGPLKDNIRDTAIFFAAVCEEGGEIWFRYFVKGAMSWSSKGGVNGLNRGNWKVSTSLIGYKDNTTKNMPVFMASVLNEDVNEVRTWTFELGKDENGNYMFESIIETDVLSNGKFYF